MLLNRWPIAAALLLLCGPVVGWAENAGVKSPTTLPFIVDATESGPGDQKLPQSSVIAITQARDGYLWLGTLNGLVRFDGTRFTVFNSANTPALECNKIVHLFEDSRTNLWVGTDPGGVVVIRSDGRFQKIDVGRGGYEKRLVSSCEDSAGAVWLYCADGRLTRYQNEQTQTWPLGSEQFANAKTVIAEPQGMVWVGDWWGQAPINPAAAFSAQTKLLPRGEILQVSRPDFLLASRRGGYWRLADGLIQKWNGAQLENIFAAYQWNNTNAWVTAACEDDQGNLIVGTHGEGVFWYDAAGHATQISTAQGLAPNARGIVLSLCVDREGNLWAGTDGGGLNRVKRGIFEVLDPSKAWTIQSVAEDASGGLWLGTFNKGLKYFKDGVVRQLGAEQSSTNLYLPNLSVQTVFTDRDHDILFGTVGFGLCQVVHADELRQLVNAQIADTNVSGVFLDRDRQRWFGMQPSISVIFQDRTGRLWFGTQAGLVCRDDAGWKKFDSRDGLSNDTVRAIADDAEGNIWIGTEAGGLNCLSNGQFRVFHKADGLPGETVTSLLADRDGSLWVGTADAGLGRLKDGQWTTYSKTNGLSSDSIGYLIEDTQSNLWMGSYVGLMRVSKKALNDFAAQQADFVPCRAFAESDGLPTSECTQGSQPAACLAHDGKLWFPTSKGLVSVNPSDLKPNTNRPPVIIEAVLVESENQITNDFGPRPQAITIPPGKERLEIHYTSLNFSAPENVRFKYKLEGHETRWFEAGNRRDAEYTKLPPGNYLFRVIAYNEDGVANLNGATLTVIVLPPFWRTGWFITLITVGMLGLIVGVVYYFSTQKLQRELAVLKQREALEHERARIARDLHDQLGANLTQVSLLGELAEADRHLPEEVESHAQQICQTARETTHALDEIVWAINPSNDTLESLVNYACKYAQEYLELAGISHRFDVPASLPAADIAPEVRHNVFLAFKESVNNVVKHAQASAVNIRLRLEPATFTLEVEDNGRGLSIQPEKSTRNGLKNLRKRMEDVGGNFFIGPASGRGTLVKLTAPLARH